MEFAPLVALREPLCIPSFASTILSKVLRRLRNRVGKQLHFHTPKGLTCESVSEQLGALRQRGTTYSWMEFHRDEVEHPIENRICQASS